MSSTSGSCSQPSGGVSSGPDAHRLAVGAVPDRDAVAPPQLAGDAPVVHVVDPGEPAGLQAGRVNHGVAVANRVAGGLGQRLDLDPPLQRQPRLDGSPLRSECPTLCRYGRFSATMRPCSASASRTLTRASKRSRPSNSVPVSAIRPLVSMIVGIGRLCRSPISKSFGSWAGVTLTAPVPNSGSTCSSATMTISPVEERVRQASCRPGAGSARRRDAPRSRCRRASSRAGWWPPRCAVRRRPASRTGTTPARPRRPRTSPRGRRSRSRSTGDQLTSRSAW